MSLAAELSRAFHAIAAAEAPAPVSAHLRTLIIDALACMLAGADAESVAIAKAAASTGVTGAGSATNLPGGPSASAANAALVNGTMLRRSEERRDGKEGVSTCSNRGWADISKKKK